MGEFFQNKLTSGEVFQRGKKKRRKREEKSGKGEEKEREKGRKRDNKVRNVLKREEKFLYFDLLVNCSWGIPHEVYTVFDMPDSDFNDFWCISTSIHAKSKSEKKNFFGPP